MNEFDLLSAAIDAAIKHGNHNQKLHGRRFGPDTGGGAGGGAGVGIEPDAAFQTKNVAEGNQRDVKTAFEGYRALGKKMKSFASPKEKSALVDYRGMGHRNINGYLAGKESDWFDRTTSAIEAIDSVMSRSTVPENTVVYRGASLSKERIAELSKVGNVINRPGYLSASASIDMASSFSIRYDGGSPVIMHIRVPAGSKAIHMDNFTADAQEAGPSELEMLLPRNSRLVVRGVRTQEKINRLGQLEVYTHVALDLLPDEESVE